MNEANNHGAEDVPVPAPDWNWRAEPDNNPADIAKLIGEMDASKWADAFLAHNTASDKGMMLAWFANAIMAGFDNGKEKAQEEVLNRRGTSHAQLLEEKRGLQLQVENLQSLVKGQQKMLDNTQSELKGVVATLLSVNRYRTDLIKQNTDLITFLSKIRGRCAAKDVTKFEVWQIAEEALRGLV